MDNLFNQDNSTQENPLESLVGEGKKFATVEDMAKGKLEADRYIEELKQKLEATSNTNAKLEELLEAIKSRDTTSRTADPDPTKTGGSEGKENTTSFNPDDIEALVSKKLEERELNRLREENTRDVQAALSKAYGDKARDAVASKMQELNMSEAEVTALAANNPTAFKRLFIEEAGGRTLNFDSTRRSEALKSSVSSNEKGWSYYREMRKKEPSKFYSPSMQREFNAQVDKLGNEVFFSI